MMATLPSWDELKRRKIVQWSLAYLAGAFAALQLLDILANHFAWPAVITRGAIVLLGFGFFVALVVAWYHGEKGRQRVSGPELLMVAGILAVAGAAIAMVGGEAGAMDGTGRDETTAAGLPATGLDSIPSRSIAVLPLDDHSPDPEDAYFAGAMTEAITNALKKGVPALRVTSRNSAEKFAESEKTLGEFARTELGVAHVIEGSVQLQDGTALVTVQLIDTATEDHVWSETYQATLADVIEMQEDVARQVAERLAATFSERAEERIRSGSTDDPRAYDLYLRAGETGSGTLEEVDRRISLLRQAVRRDPSFAMAHFELGDAYYQKMIRGRDASLVDSAFAQLDRAIEVAEDTALNAWLTAFRFWIDGSPQEAIEILRPAALENPSDHWATEFLARTYYSMGDLSRGVEWGRKVIALDPLNAGHREDMGRIYMSMGLDSLAYREYARGVELESMEARSGLFAFHLLRGEFAAARTVLDSMRALGYLWPDVHEVRRHVWSGDLAAARIAIDEMNETQVWDRGGFDAPTVAHALLVSGDTARAEALLDEAEALPALRSDVRSGVSLQLEIAAVRGDAVNATRLLREATELGWRGVRRVQASPVFSRVRDDPDFADALAEVERMVVRERAEVLRDLRRAR